MSAHYYSAFGLAIQSDLALPLVPLYEENADIHLRITYGEVSAEGLPNPLQQGLAYQVDQHHFWLNIPGIVRFLMSKGTRITIAPQTGADECSLRAFLLNSCMEIVLKQRGLLVCPGYAIRQEDYGIAFAGNLGPGQSLLQGLFYKRGYRFLGGNFFVLGKGGVLLPGIPQLEFWSTVMATLSLPVQSFTPIRPGIEKYIIPLHEQYGTAPLQLKLMYLWTLHSQQELLFTELNPMEKARYGQRLFMGNTQVKENDLQFPTWPIINISVPAKGLKLHYLLDAIEADLAQREASYVE